MEDVAKKEEIGKKMDFKDVADKRDEFFKESEEFAGKEIEAHITNGGKLDDVMGVMMEQINDSDFFRNLAPEQEDTTTSRKKATK